MLCAPTSTSLGTLNWNYQLSDSSTANDKIQHYIAGRLKEDIAIIFRGRVAWENWPTDAQINALAEQAGGLFVWARTVVDCILSCLVSYETAGRDELIRDVGKPGLEGVDGLYMFVMQRALGKKPHRGVEIRRKRIKNVLGFLVIVEHPLTLEDIEGGNLA
jgi:hypothetical protein